VGKVKRPTSSSVHITRYLLVVRRGQERASTTIAVSDRGGLREEAGAGEVNKVVLLMIGLGEAAPTKSEATVIQMVEDHVGRVDTTVFTRAFIHIVPRGRRGVVVRVHRGVIIRVHRGGRARRRLLLIHFNPTCTRRTHGAQDSTNSRLFEGRSVAQNTDPIHHGGEPIRVRLRKRESKKRMTRHC
jgi:hypothetical protein